MKYCSRCGTQLVDEAVVCTGCGCPVASTYVAVNAVSSPVATAPDYNESGLSIAAKIFMIISTIIMGIYIIPLAWCIPMTVSYFNKTKKRLPISTGFKVCSLLFVSLVGGILMLCDKDN